MKSLQQLLQHEPTEANYKNLIEGRVSPLVKRKYENLEFDFHNDLDTAVKAGYVLIFTLDSEDDIRETKDIRKDVIDFNLSDDGVTKYFKEFVRDGGVIPLGEEGEVLIEEDGTFITTIRHANETTIPNILISFTDSELRKIRDPDAEDVLEKPEEVVLDENGDPIVEEEPTEEQPELEPVEDEFEESELGEDFEEPVSEDEEPIEEEVPEEPIEEEVEEDVQPEESEAEEDAPEEEELPLEEEPLPESEEEPNEEPVLEEDSEEPLPESGGESTEPEEPLDEPEVEEVPETEEPIEEVPVEDIPESEEEEVELPVEEEPLPESEEDVKQEEDEA